MKKQIELEVRAQVEAEIRDKIKKKMEEKKTGVREAGDGTAPSAGGEINAIFLVSYTLIYAQVGLQSPR